MKFICSIGARSIFVLFATLLVQMPSEASVISGVLKFTGSLRVYADRIDFAPFNQPAVPPPVRTRGRIQISEESTGFFAQFGGTQADIADLYSGTEPVGIEFALSNFVTNPALSFTLNFLYPGVFSSAQCFVPAAPGQVCTPPGSQFSLVNTANRTSVASFAGAGTVSDGGPVSTFIGSFTRTQATGYYQSLLAALARPGGFVTSTFAADFAVTAPPIPEPGTISLLGFGSLALITAQVVRQRRRSS